MESTSLLPQKQRLAHKSLLERRAALREPSVGKAAHLIKDAVMGHQEAPYEGYYDSYGNENSTTLNDISILCGRQVVQLRLWATVTCWGLFALTFFEPPHWCRDASRLFVDGDDLAGHDSSFKEYGDCKVLFDMHDTDENQEPYQLYPSSNLMWLTIHQSKVIELACVFFIALYQTFAFGDDGFDPHLFFFPGSEKRWKHIVRSLVLVCLFMSQIFGKTGFNPFLRMLILGTFLRAGQRELWTYSKMIPQIIPPLSLLAFVIVFYAWFGVVIFYDTREGRTAFPNLIEGMWTLWICVTTANYPDVMMPAYNQHRFFGLYFVSFMALSFFYLMNLVLAIAVNIYDESIEDRKHSREQLAKKLLTEAYALLDSNSDGSVGREKIMNVMTILDQDVAEIRGLTDEEKAIMYALLDKDGSNEISLNEFLGFGSVMLIKLSKRSDYATFVEIHLPSIYNTPSYQKFCKYVKSNTFENVIEFILVLNALTVAIQDYPILAGQDVVQDPRRQDGRISTPWEAAETIFTALYVIEASLKIMANGWKHYIESPRNTFDFSITIMVLLSSLYVYYPNAYSNSHLIEFVVMARVLRLSRLLFAIESFETFGVISMDIIPAASSVIVVLLLIAYTFSTVGMLVFGGVITRDPNNLHYEALMEADDFVDNEYWGNNFNDMISGINVLFNMLVVNNWTNESAGLESATGNKWLVRLFFLTFHLLGVTGISNVITSFIINAFFQQMSTLKSRQAPDETVEGEAIVRGTRGGLRAVFDTNVITGTDTGLRRETYIAKLNPKHTDIEVDERQALREMFSSGKSNS